MLYCQCMTLDNCSQLSRLKGYNIMEHMTFGFIGLGLIGGSIAKSLKLHDSSLYIYAYDANPDNLQLALKEHIVDTSLSALTDTCINENGSSVYCLSHCDVIFLCAPVSKNNENLGILKDFISPNTLLTDVGSVKSGIHKLIEQYGMTQQFIGGHPMTGSEKSGFANAQSIILENAYYILTPTQDVSCDKIEFLKNLVSAIGALPIILEPEKHDYITAAISHVPHLIAAALVNLVKDSDDTEAMMKTLAAGGFKDITRIASSSPEMWESICMDNSKNITALMDDYIEALSTIRTQVCEQEKGSVHALFTKSRDYRDSFADTARGPIQKTYLFYVDIPDVTGSIATLATILASHSISIKNIGIVHNREFEEGVLRIEFYESSAKQQAMELLTTMKYEVFDRR